MKQILCFTDAHASPGQDLRRFDWLGQFIVDLRPDVIANLGDLATNDSVTFWSVPFLERTTLADDVEVVKESQQRLFAPMQELNARLKASKHAQYRPYTFMTKGNHEFRVDRRIEDDDTGLGSVIDVDSLFDFDVYWQDIVDWKEYFEYEGLLFTHCPTNGRGKPIDGVYRGRHISLQSDKPVVYGHTHKMDYSTVGLIGNQNRTKFALNLPCFMEQDHVEEYARRSTSGWSYGVVVLTITDDSQYTYRWISMAELEANYQKGNNG